MRHEKIGPEGERASNVAGWLRMTHPRDSRLPTRSASNAYYSTTSVLDGLLINDVVISPTWTCGQLSNLAYRTAVAPDEGLTTIRVSATTCRISAHTNYTSASLTSLCRACTGPFVPYFLTLIDRTARSYRKTFRNDIRVGRSSV